MSDAAPPQLTSLPLGVDLSTFSPRKYAQTRLTEARAMGEHLASRARSLLPLLSPVRPDPGTTAEPATQQDQMLPDAFQGAMTPRRSAHESARRNPSSTSTTILSPPKLTCENPVSTLESASITPQDIVQHLSVALRRQEEINKVKSYAVIVIIS